ncbi:formyltransferase family protein [Prevotella jejuni]|jgi:formyl transferase domain protein|uniref:formyltransferase family protein n=1 Tax=Prevotella jejuni TaxID=1177574 RepID=UPI0028E80F5F|nr:formyltransferase family protein [Prevotella jejuni]
MKIVYGCYPSFFSRVVANKLIEHNIPVTHLMLSTKRLKIEGNSIDGLSGLKFIVNRFGYRYVLFQIFCDVLLPIIYSLKSFLLGKRFYSFKTLCTKNNIQLIKSESFNNDIYQIESPDIFISMCLDQKVSNRLFNQINKLCINVHPSDIPNFGGVEPIIQLLLSPEQKMGITIHKMTEKLDDGEPVIRQYTPIKDKSYLLLMLEFIEKGTEMLSILHRSNWIFKECKPLDLKYPYRSWPTLDELKEFSNSHSYVKFKDIFNIHR